MADIGFWTFGKKHIPLDLSWSSKTMTLMGTSPRPFTFRTPIPIGLNRMARCRAGNSTYSLGERYDRKIPGRVKSMVKKSERLSLRAVITQQDDQFVVSVTLLSPQEALTIVGEQTVATIDAAHDFVEQGAP
jgi:hypothetical protein